ncbi:MAG: HEPN domain-containing protein [Dehalococcoidia bacterium]|nr:HEPN domain-containing protein [Dehalococcoidia bacterium]
MSENNQAGSTVENFDDIWKQVQSAITESIRQCFPNNREIVDNLKGMLEIVKTMRLVEDRESIQLGLDFLTVAESDIASCNVLHSKKLYPQSTYHLQQAVEKATKGYVLGFGLMKKDEIIHHRTPDLFLRALFDKTGIRLWASQLPDQSLKTIIDDYASSISKEKRKEIAQTSYNSILSFLSLAEEYQRMSKRLTSDLTRQIRLILKKEDGVNIPGLQVLSAIITLFILAPISFPHEAFTRYPAINPDTEMSPSDYVASLGIVKATPKITKHLIPQIKNLKSVLSESST